MRSDSRETELALIIRSENPEVVVTQIANLTWIANYRLLPQASQAIRDFYFDTSDQWLKAQKLALRVRKIGATHWITLKGPSRQTDLGGLERLEIEEPWSQDALTGIINELRSRGISLPEHLEDFGPSHPLEVMPRMGLKVIQNRETHRQVRNLCTNGEGSHLVLAELAIDSVIYHFGDQKICLHEVEIEAKTREGAKALMIVIESLLAMYEPTLRKWIHSKLASGEAIEKLLKKGALEGLIDMNNNLKSAAYEKIDDYLKRGSA